MANQATQIDFTSVIAALNSMTQTIGNTARSLATLVTPAKYLHITTAGTFTTPVLATSVFSLNINTGAAGDVATIYDSASTMTLPGSLEVAALTIGTTAPEMVLLGPNNKGFALNNGLVVVTTGTADITFGYS